MNYFFFILLSILPLWSGCRAQQTSQQLPLPQPATVIEAGGTYQGNWYATHPDTPVLVIATAEPVRIENSRLRGPGNLIELRVEGAQVTVFNVEGIGEKPAEAGRIAGRFFDSGLQQFPRQVVIEQCVLRGTSGIRIRDAKGATVKVRYNLAEHIDGRVTDGKGGYQDPRLTPGSTRQFLIMRMCLAMRETEVAWNRVVNVAIPGDFYANYAKADGQALPKQEDIFNFNSSGSPGDSLWVHHNLAIGAYAFDPENQAPYTGGGYIADGDKCDHLLFTHNYAINLQNYLFSVATRGTVVFRENVGVSSGLLPNGTVMGYGSTALSHQLRPSPESRFTANRVAYVNTRPAGERHRKDWNFRRCAPGYCEGNISLWPGEVIGRERELEMIREWDHLADTAGVTVGLLVPFSQP